MAISPISSPKRICASACATGATASTAGKPRHASAASASRTRRSEEHTSELQSLMRISYAVFCLKKKKIPRDPGHEHVSNSVARQVTNKQTYIESLSRKKQS